MYINTKYESSYASFVGLPVYINSLQSYVGNLVTDFCQGLLVVHRKYHQF